MVNIRYSHEYRTVNFLSDHYIGWINRWFDSLAPSSIDESKLHPDLLIRNEHRVLPDGRPKWKWQERLQTSQPNPGARPAWDLCNLNVLTVKNLGCLSALTTVK